MNHEVLKEQLWAFFDAELPEVERLALVEHLAGCIECKKTLKRWETIRPAFAGSGQWNLAASDQFTVKVMNRIEALESSFEMPEAKSRWALPEWLFPVIGYSFAFALMFLAIENRELPVNTEAVLLADVPQTSQWTFSAESADVSKLVGLP